MPRRHKARYGSGSVIQRGDTYSIKWRENGKQVMKGGFKSRELAEQALAVKVAGQDRKRAGLGIDLSKVPTLGELAEKWIEQRMNDGLHRSARDDKNRWNAYWKPQISHLKPHQVDIATVTRGIKVLLSKHQLAPNTVANALRMLSTFYSDLIEDGLAEINPVRALPKKTRKLVRRALVDEPFVEQLPDVARTIAKLDEMEQSTSVAYAVGALAGLRTGEIIGLEWTDVDTKRQVIHVRRQVRHGKVGPLKDGDEREVGIQQALLPILVAWKLKSGGKGLLFKPAHPERGGTKEKGAEHVASKTLTNHLHAAIAALHRSKSVPKTRLVHKGRDGKQTYLTWYQATRHTFAYHYMMAGGDVAKLQAELGHSDIQTTQRYAKLSPDFRTSKDRMLIQLPKVANGKIVPFKGKIGSKLVASRVDGQIESEVSTRSN